MPAFTASSPGKIILFGEHAVVYGQPAIAVPLPQVRAHATIIPDIEGSSEGMQILAPEVGLDSILEDLPPQNPIGAAVRLVLAALKVERVPACTLKISSSIPIASGLGSGAAVSVAIIKATSGFLGQPLPDSMISKLAFEVEKIHHGTPSGIDNTVVTQAKPVYFVKGKTILTFSIPRPFTLIVGDTGIRSPTKETVGDVREAWQSDPKRYETIFSAVGSITKTARQVIEGGHPERLGPLMDENHALLQEMGVSSAELDRLVFGAKEAGALGAKLSGGGRGGNMIALVSIENAENIRNVMRSAGAVNTIISTIRG